MGGQFNKNKIYDIGLEEVRKYGCIVYFSAMCGAILLHHTPCHINSNKDHLQETVFGQNNVWNFDKYCARKMWECQYLHDHYDNKVIMQYTHFHFKLSSPSS